MPRSNALRMISRCVSSDRSPPKLCHRPRDTTGSSSPLRPVRRYCMASYRSAAGRNVVTTKLMIRGSLVRFCRPRALPRIVHGDRGADEANDTLGMDPFGIQLRVVDRDVPPRWV